MAGHGGGLKIDGGGQKHVVEVKNMWSVVVGGSKCVVEGLWVGWVGLC